MPEHVALPPAELSYLSMEGGMPTQVVSDRMRDRVSVAIGASGLDRVVWDSMVVSTTDLAGFITDVSEEFCHASGYTREELIGKPHSILNSWVHSDEFFRNMWETLQSGKVWRGTVCNKKKSWEPYWVNSIASPCVDASGTVIGYCSIRMDVTEWQAEIDRFNALFEHAHVGVCEVDIEGNIRLANPKMAAMLGYTPDELCRMKVADITHHEDQNISVDQRNAALRGNPSDSFKKRFLHKNMSIVYGRVDMSLIPSAQWKAQYFISHVTDRTHEQEMEDRLRNAADTDHLTELYNRKRIMELLRMEIKRAKREGQSCAVLFMDLDGFKWVNDTFGHDVGDAVLKIVAERIQWSVRATDWVARLGWDEFVVILLDADEQEARIVGEKLLAVLSEAYATVREGKEIVLDTIASSIGAALYSGAWDAEELVRRADVAMYRAKAWGRWRMCIDGVLDNP